MKSSMDPRRAAVTALLRIQEQGGYSNIVLDDLLDRLELPNAQRATTARLVYGVIERRLTLDYLLNQTSTTPVKKMDATVREILRVGVYQLVFMQSVPSFAAINESVSLVKTMGLARLSGFVNAVLRGVECRAVTLLDSLPTTDKGLELQYSCPRAHIRAWREAYGEACMRGLLDSLNEAPPTYIRVNTMVTTVAALQAQLAQALIETEPVKGLPNALRVLSAQGLHQLPPELQRGFYFQDAASQWCCYALGARPGETVADVCAAPGGKSLTVAQYMENSGRIDAGDIYAHKCETIRRRAYQLGLSCIRVTPWDASTSPEPAREGQYDRVLCDAPCSGMGVVRRKPEIRYKDPADFADLPALQLTILSQAAKLVKPGGVLQYSTCTLRPQENEAVMTAFLEAHPSFRPHTLPLQQCFVQAGVASSHQITLFPHIHGTDGFFIASFERIT